MASPSRFVRCDKSIVSQCTTCCRWSVRTLVKTFVHSLVQTTSRVQVEFQIVVVLCWVRLMVMCAATVIIVHQDLAVLHVLRLAICPQIRGMPGFACVLVSLSSKCNSPTVASVCIDAISQDAIRDVDGAYGHSTDRSECT